MIKINESAHAGLDISARLSVSSVTRSRFRRNEECARGAAQGVAG